MSPQMAGRPRGLLADLDDTLYDYAPPELHARTKLLERAASELGLDQSEAARLWENSRAAVKKRLGERASAHSRLLYVNELVHRAGRSDLLPSVREWERSFWGDYIRAASLRTGARELLSAWRSRGGKVAIVTDLTLEVQLWKLEKFGLLPLVDAVTASEEVPEDKPATGVFTLAIERLGLRADECVIMGDSLPRDGAAARAFGIPFFHVDSEKSLQKAASELLA